MFIPHTEAERAAMLKVLGVSQVEELLEGLPLAHRHPPYNLPGALTEMELARHMEALAEKDKLASSYLGAGAYEHFIPSAVWALALRGEFATAYTPYQPEASQGTLQSIFEFQTLVSELYGLPVANASLYDGGSAAAEACLLALRHTGRRQVVVAETVHPQIRRVIQTYLAQSGAEIVLLPCLGGVVELPRLEAALSDQTAAVLIQTPNFFGCLETQAKAIGERVHQRGGLFLISATPVSLGLLASPGELGADIALGEGQPLGLPLGYGGPYLGLFACRKELMRKMPGRIVGQTVDVEGRRAYVLTLQAREQHIRREKATSNVCTNQALCALAFSIAAALLGPEGLKKMAELNHRKAAYAREQLSLAGFPPTFSHPFFNEFAVRCPRPPEQIIHRLAQDHILAGHPLGQFYPEWSQHLLVCVTEIKTKADIDDFVRRMKAAA